MLFCAPPTCVWPRWRCREGVWEYSTLRFSPVGAAPLALHLVSPTVRLSLGSREGEGDCGRCRRPPWNRSQTLIRRQSLTLQTHIWPKRADVGDWRVPPRQAPQVLSMPNMTPKAPEASLWACRFRFSAFSRKLKGWKGRDPRLWAACRVRWGTCPGARLGEGRSRLGSPGNWATRRGWSWSIGPPSRRTL